EDHIGEAVMEVLAELDRARADDRDLAAESTHRWSPCLSGRLDVASSRPKPTPAPFGLASAESARGLYREGEERGSIPPCEPWCSSGRARSRARPSSPPPARYPIPLRGSSGCACARVAPAAPICTSSRATCAHAGCP